MCGLAGFIKRHGEPTKEGERQLLQAMGSQIAHRGPDDEQILLQGSLGMVFRRLSIVDLDGGRQPIQNEDGSLTLIVNGEIYNHRELRKLLKNSHHFKTQSDSEIILHLYEEMGIDCLKELNGMFAFMLWDEKRQRLILARDRLGIKPLYFTVTEQKILFGSEIKALLAHPECPRAFDWSAALSHHFQDGRPDAPLFSFFKNIEMLPGGSFLTFDLQEDRIDQRAYWQVEAVSQAQSIDDPRRVDDVIEGYRELLADSVRLRLMSDVEVGIFLSGGIDSVSIAKLASKHKQLHCFSLFNQSTFENGDAESAFVAAEMMGLPIHMVHSPLDSQEMDSQAWKDLLWLCETHMTGAEQWFKFQLHQYAKKARPGLKVILLGQGSDEFNGGYCHELVKLVHGPQAKATWPLLMKTLKEFERQNFNKLGNAGLQPCSKFLKMEFLASFTDIPASEHPWAYHVRMFRQSLQHYNLWHEDRTAAGNHIENRVPFLDHRLVEFCCQVPVHMYPRLFWEKAILKEAMADEVPARVINRQKMGFFHGKGQHHVFRMLFDLLTRDGRGLIKDAFGEGEHPVINKPMIYKLIQRIEYSRDYGMTTFLLRLVNMGLLEGMLSAMPSSQGEKVSIPEIRAVEIADWEKDTANFTRKWAEPSVPIDLDGILNFEKGTQLLSSVAGLSKNYYLAKGNAIVQAFSTPNDEAILVFLAEVNGKATIREILKKCGVAMDEISGFLQKGLNQNTFTQTLPEKT